MQIQKTAADSLRVELTAGELQEFQLNYQLLNYREEKTQRLIKHILLHAADLTGFSRQNCRLLIEVFPAAEQGCTMYFTRLEQKKKRYRRSSPHIYRFSDVEHLFLAVEQLHAHPSAKSELYLLQNRHILILHHPVKLPLAEYGESIPAKKTTLAYIREHGKLLCAPFAVKTLLQAMNF